MLLITSFFLYFSSEVRGFKRVLSPQLAPVVVSFRIDVIAIFIGLTAGFVAMFGRVSLFPLGFPEEKPLYTKEPLYQLQHINKTALNVYLQQHSTKSPSDPFTEVFIKYSNLRSEAPYFYSLEHAKGANVRVETLSTCFPLFRNECLPRSLAGLLSTTVCPVLDAGYSASCLPLQEACFTLRSYKAVIFLSPTNLNSTCPILYHT